MNPHHDLLLQKNLMFQQKQQQKIFLFFISLFFFYFYKFFKFVISLSLFILFLSLLDESIILYTFSIDSLYSFTIFLLSYSHYFTMKKHSFNIIFEYFIILPIRHAKFVPYLRFPK